MTVIRIHICIYIHNEMIDDRPHRICHQPIIIICYCKKTMRRRSIADVLLKVILCGESRVGKSLMCHHLTTTDEPGVVGFSRPKRRSPKSSTAYEPTVGLDMAVVRRRVSDTMVAKVHVWDTSGDTKYIGIVRSYYQSCCAAIILVDMADEDAHTHVEKWLKELRNQKRSDGHNLIVSVFANVDDGKNPKNDNIAAQCEKVGVYYREVGVRNNTNVEAGFDDVVKAVYDVYVSRGLEVNGISFLGQHSTKFKRYGTGTGNGINIGNIPLVSRRNAMTENTPYFDRCCSIL